MSKEVDKFTEIMSRDRFDSSAMYQFIDNHYNQYEDVRSKFFTLCDSMKYLVTRLDEYVSIEEELCSVIFNGKNKDEAIGDLVNKQRNTFKEIWKDLYNELYEDYQKGIEIYDGYNEDEVESFYSCIDDELLSLDQASEAMGIKRTTIKNLIRQGKIHSSNDGFITKFQVRLFNREV